MKGKFEGTRSRIMSDLEASKHAVHILLLEIEKKRKLKPIVVQSV